MKSYIGNIKPLLDYLAGSVLLIVLLPLTLIVVIILLIVYRGDQIMFSQDRIGLNGKSFRLWKFRTLKIYKNNDPVGHNKNDETSIGKVLRRFRIDEWPQLINVIKGDLSLVGPRPLPIEYKSIIDKKYSWRHNMKPGITGLVQANGGNTLTWTKRFAYDRLYRSYASLWLDICILCRTVLIIFKKERTEISKRLDEE